MSGINWRSSTVHAAIVGLANSIVQLVSAFGVHLTSTQNAAFSSFMNAGLIVLSVVVISSTGGANAPPKAGS